MSGYTYIFVRQDLSPEQIAVQSAHVAMQMGYEYAKKVSLGTIHSMESDPRETYFILVGVRNAEALLAVESILVKFGICYESFVEPDIGDQVTAVATYPLNRQDRGPLLAFNLLKLG